MDVNQEGRVTSKIRGRGGEWGFKDAALDRGGDENKGGRKEGVRNEGERKEGGRIGMVHAAIRAEQGEDGATLQYPRQCWP